MAHIVCITSGLTGILYASFELVRRLEAGGHTITYASPKEVGEKVRANGIRYEQLPGINFFPAPELPRFRGGLRKLQRWWYRWRQARSQSQSAIQNLGMADFRERLDRWSPDLLLIDVELHEHLMTAVSERVPTVLLSQWFSLWPSPGLPPLLHDTLPGMGWRGSEWGLRWAWQKVRWQRWWMFAKKRWRSVGTNRRSVLLAYGRQVGFPKEWMRENYWPGPITYQGLPVLSMTLWEMEFPHPPRPQLHYVGAMVDAERRELRSDARVEAKLADLFAEKAREKKSLIYCSVSSFKRGDHHFLQRLVRAVEKRSDWLLILSLGGLLEDELLSTVPANVYPFAWVPQIRVLAQADCSINHGGIHTINECIHHRVPMLVYSGKRSDQNGCAARVAYHQLGIMADKDRDQVVDIERNIEKILTDSRYREKVETMHHHYQAYKSDQRLLRVLDPWLAPVARAGVAKDGAPLKDYP